MSRAEEDFNMSDIAALTARIERLEHDLAVQQDIHQIRRIQYTYGYFIDKSQYNEVVDLFADDAEVWFLGGIYRGKAGVRRLYIERFQKQNTQGHNGPRDRKSTRLNSSHGYISYAVFCLKKKKTKKTTIQLHIVK